MLGHHPPDRCPDRAPLTAAQLGQPRHHGRAALCAGLLRGAHRCSPRYPGHQSDSFALQRGGGPGAGGDGAADTSVPGPGGRHHGPRHTELYIYNVIVQLFPQ